MAENSQELAQVTAVIKTFERPRCLDRLIRSIRRFYPEMKIIVADDSYRPYPRDDIQYLRLRPDTGASAGRNALLERIGTPYFLLLDDDWEFNQESRLERLMEVVESGSVTLAAGTLTRCKRKLHFFVNRRPQPYHGLFRFDGDHLIMKHGWYRDMGGYYLCDIVNNFFIARTDDVRKMGGWDPDFKTEEHIEFFLRFRKAGLEAAYCPEISIYNWYILPRRYRKFRRRSYDHLYLQKHGIRRLTHMHGQTDVFDLAQAM